MVQKPPGPSSDIYLAGENRLGASEGAQHYTGLAPRSNLELGVSRALTSELTLLTRGCSDATLGTGTQKEVRMQRLA